MARALGLREGRYVVVTLHRPSNVDDPDRLDAVLRALCRAADTCGCPVVFPVHPRTAQRISEKGIGGARSALNLIDPLRYVEFLSLMSTAGAVVTDSGGIQDETTVLGIPCITLRPDTERPVTVSAGTNRLFDDSLELLPEVVLGALGESRRPVRPPLWDGKAAHRIAEITVRSETVLRPRS